MAAILMRTHQKKPSRILFALVWLAALLIGLPGCSGRAAPESASSPQVLGTLGAEAILFAGPTEPGERVMTQEFAQTLLFSDPIAPAGKPRPAWSRQAQMLRPRIMPAPVASSPGATPQSLSLLPFAPPEVVAIPAGPFIAGSDDTEREAAYQLDEAGYGHKRTRTRRWYSSEIKRQTKETGAYFITKTPITNRDYAYFVAATRNPAPGVGPRTWAIYNVEHSYQQTQRFAWVDRHPPPEREDHPVVLVSWRDAKNYAEWLSKATKQTWRLPTEAEWEKAARGTEGLRFPWGDEFIPGNLNSADAGPNDTMPVGSFQQAASPFGVLDAAGQVYEWSAEVSRPGFRVVKGGAWDAKGCGQCRPAARHDRPQDMKYIVLGFRLVRMP
jgi:formylglycine-generating enzyme required for sulfatase activity